MRRRPNRDPSDDSRQAAERFVSAAEELPATEGDTRGATYPWERSDVREDVKQTYPLRLPEPLHLKLKFVSEETGRSMNALCNEAVEALVEEQLEKIT